MSEKQVIEHQGNAPAVGDDSANKETHWSNTHKWSYISNCLILISSWSDKEEIAKLKDDIKNLKLGGGK